MTLPSWRLPAQPAPAPRVAFSLAVVIALVYLPLFQKPLGTVALSFAEVTLVVALALAPALLTEVGKAVGRRS